MLHPIKKGNKNKVNFIKIQINFYNLKIFSILHLFPWSGIVDEDSQLSDTFRVPDPKTGQMRRLISQIPPKEEEMFRNMIRRLNTIVKVIKNFNSIIQIESSYEFYYEL